MPKSKKPKLKMKLYKAFFKKSKYYADELIINYEIFAAYSKEQVIYWLQYEDLGARCNDEWNHKKEIIEVTSKKEIKECLEGDEYYFPYCAFIARNNKEDDKYMDYILEDFIEELGLK